MYMFKTLPNCPKFFLKCRNVIPKCSIIIHEVKSHVGQNSKIGSDLADKLVHLVGSALKFNFNDTTPLILFSWLNSKLFPEDFRCYGQTVLWDALDPG